MKEQLAMVQAFHDKFRAGTSDVPTLITEARATLRYDLMREEVEEYRDGVERADLPNLAKELADILYAVYGTVIEHGLQDKMEDIFTEVHRSHMTKEYHEFKMVKGPDFSPAEVTKFFQD